MWRCVQLCTASQTVSRQSLVKEYWVYYPVRFGSMMYKMTLWQVLLRIFRFLWQYHFANAHIFWARFAKLRIAAINVVMSVRVFAWKETIGSLWTNFHEIWNCNIRKIVQKILVSLQWEKNEEYFTRSSPIYVHLRSHLAQLLLQWEMFQTKVGEKTKTPF